MAIQKTSEKNKALFLEKHQDFISKFNDIDKYIGDVFTLNLLGIANHGIIKITIDRNQKAIAFAIDKAAMPHYYFKKISYAFVRYYDAMGIERYQYNFIGDKTTIPEEKIFPLTQQGGEKLFIHHKEANVRFKFYNLMQDKLIQPNLNNTKQIQVTYQFKTNGLQELSNDSPENIQLPKDMIVSSLTHALSMSTSTSEIRCPIENISTEFSEVNNSLPSINNVLINN